MRRMTGTYDGVEHVILEYTDGQVECPSNLHDLLVHADGSMPTDEALLTQLRVLFGDTLQVREV